MAINPERAAVAALRYARRRGDAADVLDIGSILGAGSAEFLAIGRSFLERSPVAWSGVLLIQSAGREGYSLRVQLACQLLSQSISRPDVLYACVLGLPDQYAAVLQQAATVLSASRPELACRLPVQWVPRPAHTVCRAAASGFFPDAALACIRGGMNVPFPLRLHHARRRYGDDRFMPCPARPYAFCAYVPQRYTWLDRLSQPDLTDAQLTRVLEEIAGWEASCGRQKQAADAAALAGRLLTEHELYRIGLVNVKARPFTVTHARLAIRAFHAADARDALSSLAYRLHGLGFHAEALRAARLSRDPALRGLQLQALMAREREAVEAIQPGPRSPRGWHKVA